MDQATPIAPESAVLDTSKAQHPPPPPVVFHLNTPSGALVQAIFDQDIQAVNKVLDSDPGLANSLVSHRGPLYKKWLQDQDAGMGYYETLREFCFGTPPRLVEPAVVFAATAHSWKDASCVSRDIPAQSVAIVRTLIERGATLSCSLGLHDPVIIDMVHNFHWPHQAIWAACSRQDSPEILELLIHAGADPLGSAMNLTEIHGMAIEAATINDGDGSVAFLLDYAIAAHDKIDDYVDFLHLAASMANQDVVNVFLRKAGLGMFNRRLPRMEYGDENPIDTTNRPRCSVPTGSEYTVLMEVVHCHAFCYFGYNDSGLVRAWALPDNLRRRESLVNALLDAGADASVRRIKDNATLIHGASRWAGPATLRRIIASSGCDIKETYHHTPSLRGNPGSEPPPGFICGGDGVGYLHIAARYFNILGAQELVKGGIQPKEDASGKTALHWVSLSDAERVKLEREQEAQDCGPIKSGSNPALQMAEYLVEIGVDIDAQDCWGRTALHYACRFKNVGLIVKLLLLNANCGLKDSEGNTALHALSQKGFIDDVIRAYGENIGVVSELVLAFTRNQSFKPDEKNANGETSLIIACKMATIATVEILLSLGCNPNVLDKESWAPLHLILKSPDHVRLQDVAMTEDWDREEMKILKLKTLLLEAGADESLVNNEGQTYADMEAAEAVATAEARQRGKEYMERLRQFRQEEERERRSRPFAGLASSGRGRRPLPPDLAPQGPMLISQAGHGRGKGH